MKIINTCVSTLNLVKRFAWISILHHSYECYTCIFIDIMINNLYDDKDMFYCEILDIVLL